MTETEAPQRQEIDISNMGHYEKSRNKEQMQEENQW